MACQIEKVQAILGKLEKHVDVSELKAQVDKKIAEKQSMMNFSEAFKKERPSAIKWLAKEEAKYKVATQAISDGVYDSTAGFIKRFYGDRANSGNYTKDDVIYLSTNGNRKGRLAPVVDGKLQGAYANIDKAIEVGASFVADTSSHLKSTSKYNIGEVELANYLSSKGYVREDKSGYGLWTKQYNKPLSSIIKDDYGYTIINPTGKEVGTAFIEEYYKDGTIGITIDLNSNERNKGYGIASYLQIAISENKTLKSVNPNENAYRLWNSLVKKGVASRVQVGVWKGENSYSFAKDGMPQYEFLLTPTNAKNYLQTLQNTNGKKEVIADSTIKWDAKNNTIVNSDGKTKVKVNTLDELTKLSEEYHDLLTSKLGSSDVDFEKHKEYFLGLFKQLETAGIKFKPVTVHFTKTVKNEDLGHAFKNKDEIELSTSKVFENRYPLKVALHEYAHIITMNELDKYPELAKRAKEIMNNVLKQFPGLANEYGFKNEYEFIAEVISSPRFQTQLAAAKSDGKSSIVDKVKKIFNYLLGKVNSTEVNALTDALEVVIGLTSSNVKNDTDSKTTITENKVSGGVFLTSNVPVNNYMVSTKNVDKSNKALVNTIISAVSHMGGSADNKKEMSDKIDYVLNNITDDKLKAKFNEVLSLENSYIAVNSNISEEKIFGDINTLDYWKDKAVRLAEAHANFDKSVQELYDILTKDYGATVTTAQKYSENIKTGKLTDVYSELFVNNDLIKSSDSTSEYSKDQELAKANDTVVKNKPFYKHYIKDSVMGDVYPHTMLNGETVYVPAGNTGFYYDSNKKRIDIQSTGSSMQSKLNDAINHIIGDLEYQHNSSFRTISLVDEATTNRELEIINSMLQNLREMYTQVRVDTVKELTDKYGKKVLGSSARGVVTLVEGKVALDTLPHEYAHVYIDMLKFTPEVSSLIEKLKSKYKTSEEDAKEILADMLGKLYVDNKVDLKDVDIGFIKQAWQLIQRAFRKLFTDKDIKKLAEDFMQGNNRIEVNDKVARQMAFRTLQRNPKIGSKVDGIVGKVFENIPIENDIETKLNLLKDLVNNNGMLSDTNIASYISIFKDVPMVQEAVSKWGSKEALIKAVLEQVEAKKGKAYGWWNEFRAWVATVFKSSKVTKEEMADVLSDAYIEMVNINNEVSEFLANSNPQEDATINLINNVYSTKGVDISIPEFLEYSSSVFSDSKVPYVVTHSTNFSKGEYNRYAYITSDKDGAVKTINDMLGGTNYTFEDMFYIGTMQGEPAIEFKVAVVDALNDSNKSVESAMYAIRTAYEVNHSWIYKEAFSKKTFGKGIGGNYAGNGFYFYGKTGSQFPGYEVVAKVNVSKLTTNSAKGWMDTHDGYIGSIPFISDSGQIEIVVKEPEQIHIFGSEEDLVKLKAWKENRETSGHVRGSDDYEGKFGTDSDVQTQAIPSIDLGKTLKDVFWNLETDDRGTITSDGEESASVPIRSQEFAAFTMHLLDTYEKNMNDLGMGNVAIDFYKNEDLNTSGMINLDTKKMSLRYNRMSRTARISEIFLHEVNHLVSADVFANNPRLRRLMGDLRQASLNSGIDYKVFLENVDTPTSEEIEIAKRKFDRVFDNTADPEEFYAYATTNEDVYNAIKDIEVKGELIKPLGKVDNTMQKILQRLIDVVNQVWSVTTGRSQKGSQQILNMVNMIDTLARQKAEETKKEAEPSVTNRVKNIFNKIDEKVNPIMDKIEAKSKKLKRGLPSTKMLNKIMDLKMMRDIAGSGAIQYLIREVTRDTTAPEFAEMYQITRKTKQVVERATNQIKVGVKDAVDQMFDGETDSTKKAITHVMFDLDLGHLLDTMDKDGVVDMIMDPTKRAAEIVKVETELGTTIYDEQIDGLAEYIVSGNTVMMNQQINANNIVEYKNQYPKVNSKTYKDTRKHIALVDKLVSLKALDKVSTENAKLVQDYLSKEGKSDVLMDSLMMYKNYMDQMKKDAQTSQYNPIKKGYTQAPASLIKYALIPEDQVKAQLSVNMHLESENVYVTIAGKNYYLMTGKIKSVGFNEGALGMISNTLDGVSISSLMRDRFEEVGYGIDQIDEKIEKLVADISTGKAKGRQFNLGEIKSMIPVHNKAGKIVDYRIQLNKIDRIEMLKEEEDVAKVLAHTYARADKLVRTAEQNRNVVDTVIRQSAIGMSENPEDYVVIEEYTKEDREAGLPYTKLNERWDRIPDYTKDYIREKLGVSKLPIHKDFVELITGEKQMTLGNFNYLGLDMKQHPIARARIMALESWVRELLAYVKQTTVVLNGSIVMGNTISNMITAAVHGVDPITYVGEVRKKWLLLNEYNELERKLARLNVDRMAGKDVDRKIRQLEDQKVRHPYHALVEDGQFSPIVEDINVDMETNGQLATMLKNAIDKTRLGKAIHPVLEFAYLDKKTKIYKTMLKVTQYGDAITRQIILEKNVSKREAKLGRKLTREEYQEELNYVDQLLINYGYVANRVWDWMEKVAGLNFMKYYLRNIKATYKMFDKNKSATIFEMGMQYLTGVDFSDSMDTYAKSPIMALTNRFMLDDVPSELSTPHIFELLPNFSSIVKFH